MQKKCNSAPPVHPQFSLSLIHLLPLALIDITNEAEETEKYEMNPV